MLRTKVRQVKTQSAKFKEVASLRLMHVQGWQLKVRGFLKFYSQDTLLASLQSWPQQKDIILPVGSVPQQS
jgi:hypothetical protein